jgi:hypothetical protein
MEPRHFDGLARLVGGEDSRRTVLKRLAAGAIGAAASTIGLQRASAAARKRADGSVCAKHADCDSGACYPKDRTGRRLCGPNLCTDNQVVCEPLDDCHLTGVCEPTTGICSNPAAPDGTDCARYSGACSAGVCELFPTLSCSAGSQCQSHCPDSVDSSCTCGTTIQGDPVCYRGVNGCAGHYCATVDDCADLGPTSVCLYNFCSAPGNYCSSGADCAEGWACVNINGGCGGCDNFTQGQGVCNPRCTS